MSSIRNITSSTAMPNDLAKKLGPTGVNEILNVLWKGYHDLKADTTVVITASSEEDDITQEWFVKVQRIWDSRNRATALTLNRLVPMHQYADNTLKKRRGVKSPTIDFCFKDWSTANSYFGAEAKNLYNSKPQKVERYVTTGVINYIQGRYGSYSSQSAIIGYVLSGSISEIVEELRTEIKKLVPISNLTRSILAVNPQYKTEHKRITDGEEITLHHLFFSFVA